MKLCTYVFISLLLTSCIPKINVTYPSGKIFSVKENIFIEEELVSVKALNKSSSGSLVSLQNCSFEYAGMNQSYTDDCSSLSNFSFDQSLATISWNSLYEKNGIYRFNITASENGVVQNENFVVEIKRKNRIPVLTNPASIVLTSGQDFLMPLLGSDPDIGIYDDVLSFSCLSCPSGMTINSQNELVYASSLIGINDFAFTIEVKDQYGGKSQKDFTVNIVSSNVAPVLNSVANINSGEGTLITINLSATDSDGNPITYSYSCDPVCTGSLIDSTTGVFSWTPGFSQDGIYDVTFTATDGSLSHSQNTAITVTNTNRAPTLADISPVIIAEAEDVLITLVASDPDGDSISFSYLCTPECPGAIFNTTLGTFAWTTDYTMAGNYAVSFTVTDNYIPSASITKSTTIAVNNVNRLPTLAAVANRSLVIGQTPTPTISLVGNDLDGDTLTYSFNCAPACSGATINATTGVFSWSPPVGSVGTYLVTFEVSDSVGTASQTSTITVAATNNLPVFGAIKNRVTKTTEEEIILFSTTDTDADTITYTCHILDINLPGNEALEVESTDATCESKSFLNFESTNGRLVFNTLVGDVGFYRVLLRANDTKGVSETRFSVSVNREIMDLVIKPDYNSSLDYLLPVRAKTNKKYLIDWGDSANPQMLSGNYPTHTYSAGSLSVDPACTGCINIRVGGELERIHHYNTYSDGTEPDSIGLGRAVKQLYKVESIGDLYWSSLSFAFSDCANLISAKTGFVSNTFSQTQYLFDYNTSLESVDFNGFNASSVLGPSGFYNMFNNTPSLKNVSFAGINSTGVKNFGGMFSYSSIETVDMNSLNFSGAQNFKNMFYNAQNIKHVDFSNAIIPNVTIENITYDGDSFQSHSRFDHMFQSSNGLLVDFSNATISDTLIKNMFRFAGVKNYNFSGATLTATNAIYEMFSVGGNIESIDFSNATINANNFTDGAASDLSGGMFYDIFVEGKIDFSNAILNIGSNPERMIQKARGSDWDLVFKGATINAPIITNYMFKELDLKNIDFSDSMINVTNDVINMFFEIKTLDLNFSNSIINAGASITQMFNKVRKNDDYFMGRINEFNISGMKFINSFNSNPLNISSFIYNSYANHLNMTDMSFDENSTIYVTDMFSLSAVNYTNFTNVDFRSATVTGLYDSSDVYDIQFVNADLSGISNLSNFIGILYNSNYISFTSAVLPSSMNISQAFQTAIDAKEIDLSAFVGVNIGADVSYLFRFTGANSPSVAINLASRIADGSGNYPSIDFSTVTDSTNIFLDMNPSAIFYCDYDPAPGSFGTFFGRACTDPALYVPSTP